MTGSGRGIGREIALHFAKNGANVVINFFRNRKPAEITAKKLEEMGIVAISAELQRIPNDTKTLNLESAKSVLRLLDVLEDDDDVQNVFHNLEMTDELAAELG